MGANELSNRVEAAGWIAAAGQVNGDNEGQAIAADGSQFFFRSISGFVNKIEVLNVNPAVDTWLDLQASEVTLALFLDRNYARKDTSIGITPIESFREQSDDPAVSIPVSYEGMLRVLPMSQAAYDSVKAGSLVFPLPESLDPYSVIIVVADLSAFQAVGAGVEFGIQVSRMSDNDAPGTTDTTFIPPPAPPGP